MTSRHNKKIIQDTKTLEYLQTLTKPQQIIAKTVINSYFTYHQTTPTQYLNTKTTTKKDIEKWLNYLHEKKLSQQTIYKYKLNIQYFFTHYKKIKLPPKKQKSEPIEDDPKVANFIFKKQTLKRKTKLTYYHALSTFSECVEKPITQIVNELKIEQRSRIVGDIIIDFNPNEGTLNNYMIKYIKYLQNKNRRGSTIDTLVKRLRTFFTFYNIKLPKPISIDNTPQNWHLLTKSMIKTAIDDGNPLEKALYSFMASTGIRISDVLNFKVQDFMSATKQYHNNVRVDDFLNQAPENMIGFWEFYPQKTQRNKIKCAVFNSPESSNYLLKYLKLLNSKLILKTNGEYGLKKTDFLFSPYTRNIGQKYTMHGISSLFDRRNKILYNIEKKKLFSDFKNDRIDEDDYYEKIDCIPKFKPHQLRKYAASTFANSGVNLRVCALFEGHKPPLENDNSYIKLNKEILQEEYYKCLPNLSFEKTEVNTITTADKFKLEQLIKDIEEIKAQPIRYGDSVKNLVDEF